MLLLLSRRVYIQAEDARTDVILAAAVATFGGMLRTLVAQVPGYPQFGVAAATLNVVWLFAVTGLVPLLLARYRTDHAAAFGLAKPRIGVSTGMRLATIIGIGHVLLAMAMGAAPPVALLGRVAGATNAVSATFAVMQFVTLTLGATLLITFLSRRGAYWGRSPDVPLAQLLRSVGIGSASVALLAGAVRSIGGAGWRGVLVTATYAGILVVVVLATDRVVSGQTTVARTSVLAPVIVVAVIHLFATGGLFRGDLITAIYAGGLAVGITTVVAALTQTRTTAWAPVPLLAALHWWPSCLSPLAYEIARAC